MHNLTKKNLPAAYDDLIRLCWFQGTKKTDERGNITKSLHRVFIEMPCNPQYPDFATTTKRFGENFAENLINPEPYLKHDYTYGHRVNYRDNLNRTVEILAENNVTRRCIIPVFMPEDVAVEREVPCVTQIIFAPEGNQLEMTIFMRSNDIVGAFPSDAYGFMKLQRYVAEQSGYRATKFCYYCENAHIIMENDQEFVEKHIKTRPRGI